MEYMKTLPDKAFDLAVVDPPYGVKYARGKNGWGVCDNRPDISDVQWDSVPAQDYFAELQRVSKHQIVWGGNYFTDKLPVSKCWIVWDKICQTQNKSVFADCELAWTSFTRVCKEFKLRQMGFIHDTQDAERIHPTQKPTELYRWIFENYAHDGDRILDTHLGSGSSRIAAYDAGLDFVGCEIDPVYYAKQEERFAKHTAQTSLFD
jgi:site-specific DNA-methyltransferase (adenine-specific)